MTPTTGRIPPPILRRLCLSLGGWRFRDGVWILGRQRLSEEQVDAMSPRRWARLIRPWATSARN
jgi:hypothetical protein